jgi:hypothetical protein
VVGPKEVNQNFKLAMRNLELYTLINPNEINILNLLQNDKIIFTEQSLREFTELFLAAWFMFLKPKAVKDKKIEDMINLNFSKEQPDFEEE